MSQKVFGNDLVAIRKNKSTLTLNKPAYVGMCLLDLSKVLMQKFHIFILNINIVTSQDYYSLTLTVWCMK